MRGDLVTIALQGDFGKPRPALVIQADLFDAHASVTLLPITSTLVAGSAMPIASDRQFIEFAVYMPAHEPQPGQELHSAS